MPQSSSFNSPFHFESLATFDAHFESAESQWQQSGVYVCVAKHPTSLSTQHSLIIHIAIKRPQVRNALDLDTMKALAASLVVCQKFDQEQRLLAVIVSGCKNYFIAGGDLKALHQIRGYEQAKAMSKLMFDHLEILSNLSCISFAAIEGFAIGGGAEIALACDVRVMSNKAYWLFPQVTLGLSSGWGGAKRLTQIVGASRALAIFLEAERIKADVAYQLGLSQILCEPQQCENHILQLLYTIADHQQAIMSIKHLVQVTTQQPHSYALQEQDHFATLWSSEAHWQQVQKFWKNKELKGKNKGQNKE